MTTLFEMARKAWDDGARLRDRRHRYKSYTYGRQWDDTVRSPSGEWMTEGELAAQNGREPLTNNMIRQLIKSVIGRFRSVDRQGRRPDCLTGSVGPTAISPTGSVGPTAKSPNGVGRSVGPTTVSPTGGGEMMEKDCRLLEEFLISGCAIQRVAREMRPEGGMGMWVDNVSPDRFFVNRFNDPMGNDIELIGMLHDMSPNEVMLRFGGVDGSRVGRLEEIYTVQTSMVTTASSMIGDELPVTFLQAAPGRCRVIEVWRLELEGSLRCHDHATGTLFTAPEGDLPGIEAANRERKEKSAPEVTVRRTRRLQWHGYWFAPNGELLGRARSPLRSGRHPFVVKFYPLTDGEVHPFVEDIIDQQRYINRLITLIDHVMGSAAKGVLLFPVDQKPENLTWDQIQRQWCKANGVVPYVFTGGEPPRQVYASGNVAGAYELLGLEMKLFEQISGVSGALQGQSAPTGTAASLYDSQIRNAAISLLDIFETFEEFRRRRNELVSC